MDAAGIDRTLLSASLEGAIPAVAQYGAKGFKAVKHFPGEGWYADDPKLYPSFDAVQDAGLAALVQCGIAGLSLSHEAGKLRARSPTRTSA